MAYIITKSDERKAAEEYTASCFGVGRDSTPEQREAVEIISRRTEEAIEIANKMEGR